MAKNRKKLFQETGKVWIEGRLPQTHTLVGINDMVNTRQHLAQICESTHNSKYHVHSKLAANALAPSICSYLLATKQGGLLDYRSRHLMRPTFMHFMHNV